MLSTEEFEQLYRLHKGSIYRTVRGIVLNPAAAEDLSHDAWEKAWCRRDTFRGESSARAWVTRIAVNVALTYLRRQKLHALSLPVVAFLTENRQRDDVADSDSRTDMEAAMAQLTAKQRAILGLTHYQALTRPEVAQVLGIPSGTVASRLNSATNALRTILNAQRNEVDASAR